MPPILIVTEVSETKTSVVTADCVNTPSLTAPVLVKNRFVPLYSIEPLTGVVRFVPEVNAKGAEPAAAAPALKAKVPVKVNKPSPLKVIILVAAPYHASELVEVAVNKDIHISLVLYPIAISA